MKATDPSILEFQLRYFRIIRLHLKPNLSALVETALNLCNGNINSLSELILRIETVLSRKLPLKVRPFGHKLAMVFSSSLDVAFWQRLPISALGS